MVDFSFIRFFKNDFDSARVSDNQPVSTLGFNGFVVQKTNETFTQKSNTNFNLSFVGGILVELVDFCGNVKQNITTNFFYSNFTDKNGVIQIDFEFGNLGVDYYAEPLYIKITDLINGNIFYSTCLLVTDYYKLTTLAYYWSIQELNGFAYDIAPIKQSIRFVNCYFNDIDDTESKKEYTQYLGDIVNFRSIVTDFDSYKFEQVDIFTYRRLQRLFQSDFVYLNNQRVELNEIKKDARKGVTNWFVCDFKVNPKDEFLTLPYQLYQPFRIVSLNPPHNSITSSNIAILSGVLSANITLNTGTIVLWENNTIIYTFTQLDIVVVGNTFTITLPTALTNIAVYNAVISNGLFSNGTEFLNGLPFGSWTFEIAVGEYDNTEYDNTQYLTT